jgi:putative transcriptional regulator
VRIPHLAFALIAGASLSAQTNPAAGKLLIAERHLLDPNFSRTVVLLLDHDEESSLGLVVNRPTSFAAARLLPQVEALAERGERIFIGGPVGAEQVWVLSRGAAPDGVEVVPGVWFTTSAAALDQLAASADTEFRVFGGYAGWGAGQLAGEIERGDWRVLPATEALIFSPNPERLWQQLYEKTSIRFAHGPAWDSGGKWIPSTSKLKSWSMAAPDWAASKAAPSWSPSRFLASD